MKTIMKMSLFMALIAVFMVTTSCSKDEEDNMDPQMNEKSIAQLASDDDQLSILVEALQKADLYDVLNASGSYTVFAPTNSAFTALLTDLGLNSLDDLTKEQLEPILLYHVLDDQVKSSAIQPGYVYTLSTAAPDQNALALFISTSNGVMLNGSSKVVAADVEASNGVVHVIDKVIVPPTIVDFALNNPDFSILVEALVRAELVDALLAEGPFTVFAPTNQAFEDLFMALGVSGIDDLSKEQLTPILLYHVVNGNVTSGQVNPGMVPTLNSEASIEISVTDGTVMLNNSATVIAVDVQGVNGVIHAIDAVIIP